MDEYTMVMHDGAGFGYHDTIRVERVQKIGGMYEVVTSKGNMLLGEDWSKIKMVGDTLEYAEYRRNNMSITIKIQ